MSETDRKMVQDLYIRVCRDSGFGLPFERAAAFVGDMLGTTALDVWVRMGVTTDDMMEIAAGKHSCLSVR